MRFLTPLSLLVAAVGAFAAIGGAARPPTGAKTEAVRLTTLRVEIDHYRRLTWTFERTARAARTRTSFVYRHAQGAAYLHWSLQQWERRAALARRRALASLHSRFLVPVPAAPREPVRLWERIRYNRLLTSVLGRWTAAPDTRPGRRLASASAQGTLRYWQVRAAKMALRLSEQGPSRLVVADQLTRAFLCIHHYEGSWGANTGNGYYGGLQMDLPFQRAYGAEFVARWGTANHWPVWAQVVAGRRAYASGRGFGPWPNTARACGLG